MAMLISMIIMIMPITTSTAPAADAATITMGTSTITDRT
jgi:hypothetical protein